MPQQRSFDEIISFARNSTAWYWNGTNYVEAQIDEPRRPAEPLVQGVIQGLLIEGAATNELTDSNDFSGSSDWDGTSDFTIESAPSVFDGIDSYRLENDGSAGSRAITQGVGTLTGNPETVAVIVENIDADDCAFGIRDQTASEFVVLGRITFATGAVDVQTGTGSVTVEQILESGPNEGPVYRVTATGTGTAANNRRVFIYPSGSSQNTNTVVLHHVQHEESPQATSPIFTEAATVTRAQEECEYQNLGWFVDQAGAFLFDVVLPNDLETNSYVFEISDGSISNRLLVNVTSGSIRATAVNAGSGSSAVYSSGNVTGMRVKAAIGIDGDDVRISYNGESVQGVGQEMPSGMTTAMIGQNRSNNVQWNGIIRDIRYRRANQTDEQLRAWSAL